MKNFRKVKSFEGGYSTDLTNNIEKDNTFQKALGGRLYSKDGVFSFSGGAGSKLIYDNANIVKYLGFHSFKDEIVVFAKCLYALNEAPLSYTEFENHFSLDPGSEATVDFAEYYTENNSVPNQMTCPVVNDPTPINNIDYNDCLISFRLDKDYNFIGTVKWVGQQNWPTNGKITTEGVDENEFYKRIYYTDAINYKRVVNLKDTLLVNRTAGEFNQILNNTLLQPEITSITDGGQLKAMKVLYVYRIISSNGQLSEFSPSSFYANILPENTAIEYRGGDISEVTNKLVNIKCNIIDADPSSEVECIALEYEALGPPTAIRNLGIKSVAEVVTFTHYGNEAEFADNLTYNDIINYKNTWKYCNDFSSKKNKLIAGSLRNEPISTSINNLEYLFPLHSWKADGTTHNSLINPEPWNYRYIDPLNTQEILYIKERIYRTISSFGPLTLKLVNKLTNAEISLDITDMSLESYTSILPNVIEWLLEQQSTNVNFNTLFPNLLITNSQGQLLFSQINDLLKTDVSNYSFVSNNKQFVENFDNNIVFLPVAVNLFQLVYGAQSAGFNKGVGLRITYREFKEPLLNQATGIYDGTDKILDFHTPSGEKYMMKGEIYRLGFNAFDKDSTRLFTIPLGDVMIPNIGDIQTYTDAFGNPVITSLKYQSQSVENGILYGHGIKMHIEVRLDCELQQAIPMYQLVYVERDENNRTIICQGISAPLSRVQDSGSGKHKMPNAVRNKWTLPYSGGPFYEEIGFVNYDNDGENDQYIETDDLRRVMTHRGLMYFDSPDLYFGKVSDQFVKSSTLNIVGKLNTDHTPNVIMEHGGVTTGKDEVYPKFSRKILEPQIQGDTHVEGLPRICKEEDYDISLENYFYNVSVFSEFTSYNNSIGISKAREMKYGEVVSGDALEVDNDVSNNAFSLPVPPWYFSGYARNWSFNAGTNARSTLFIAAMTSPGYRTMIIKASEDLFTQAFTGIVTLPQIDSQVRLGSSIVHGLGWDTVPLINLYRNNRESVYGGRSEKAYSQNTYIPLSRTIPTLKTSNNSQVFDVGADVYVTLNIRTKNDWGDDEIKFVDLHNHDNGLDSGSLETYTRNAAWAYAVVLESQVEPKLAYGYEFYRNGSTHNFDIARSEMINGAYLNENNLKSYVPKPFKFKDDPNRGNVIAVSDVKLAGEYYDSWTVFKVNNFYSLLERDKGDISNLVKQGEELFAIQERQTSLVYIGTDRIVQDAQGSPINIQQGSGTIVEGHKIVSDFGTSIRRAVVESQFGFCFFDERKVEFVKVKEPLLVKHLLHLEYFNRFKENKIIDTEAYFDQENKETCIRIRSEKGDNFTLSYNEAQGVFNGEFPYDNDIYMMFDEKIYSPITADNISQELHQLNAGDILNFFNVQHDMVLGFYIKADIDKVFQYKQVGIITNIDYPVKQIIGKSNLGYDRIIFGDHVAYAIREGIHTVPMINETNDQEQCTDVRGNWVYIEITAESLNQNKVDILAVLNDLRYSHQ